jgi:hypothetical protein
VTRYRGEVLEDLQVSDIRVNTHLAPDVFRSAVGESARGLARLAIGESHPYRRGRVFPRRRNQ